MFRPAGAAARGARIRFDQVTMRGLAAVIAAVLSTGCARQPRNDAIGYAAPLAPADPVAVVDSAAPYRLAARDRFTVTIYRMPDLTREYVVEPSGIVNFPLVGEVQVAGLTSAELTRLLADRYNRTQLRNPSVSVQIAEMAPRTVTVEGAVRTPGSLAITAPITLIDAIARAGGPGDLANEKRVVVFRQINGTRQAAAFDLRQVREGLMENPVIYPGDTVILDGSALRRDMRDYLAAVPLLALFNPFR